MPSFRNRQLVRSYAVLALIKDRPRTVAEIAREFAERHDPKNPDLSHGTFIVGIAYGQLFTAEFFGGGR